VSNAAAAKTREGFSSSNPAATAHQAQDLTAPARSPAPANAAPANAAPATAAPPAAAPPAAAPAAALAPPAVASAAASLSAAPAAAAAPVAAGAVARGGAGALPPLPTQPHNGVTAPGGGAAAAPVVSGGQGGLSGGAADPSRDMSDSMSGRARKDELASAGVANSAGVGNMHANVQPNGVGAPAGNHLLGGATASSFPVPTKAVEARAETS